MLKTRITVDEFEASTEGDLQRSELIDGEIVYVNDPRWDHARLQLKLGTRLQTWCEQTGRGEVGGPTHLRMTEHDAFGPDLSLVPRGPALNERGFLATVPLLCVEIRSPSTWHRDVGHKRAVYESEGVPELWLVDGAGSVVLVFRRSEAGAATYDVTLELGLEDTLSSPLLPGFALSVGDLFA